MSFAFINRNTGTSGMRFGTRNTINMNDGNYRAGLIYKSYATNNTYNSSSPNNALSYFTGATRTSLGTTTSINYNNASFNTLDTYTKSNSIPINFALSFYGYFIPKTKGLWTFTFYGDDVISFWIGNEYQNISNFLSSVSTSTMNFSIVSATIQVTPLAFTTNTLSISSATYTNGTYTASASSILNSQYDAYTAFNGSTNNASCWISSDANSNYLYTVSTGVYSGTTSTTALNTSTNTTSAILGEWLQINIPYSLVLSSYTIYPRADVSAKEFSPNTWYILGSTDGTNWVILHTVTGYTFPDYLSLQTFTLTGETIAYSYFRMVITVKYATLGTRVGINQWNINGFPPGNYSYSVNLTDGTPYPMLLNYGQSTNNAICQMGITPPSGSLTYNGTPYLFN